MMKFTLFTADCVGSLPNCVYPHKAVITDEAGLKMAVSHDHVTAEYKNNYRSGANFIRADNVPLDCDNDHSDDPDDWVTPFEVAMAFPDVSFAVVYSRNHMRVKEKRSARPRFHVYFLTPEITDPAVYTDLKKQIAAVFPYFDSNALDSARLLFGAKDATVEIYNGSKDVVEYLEELAFEEWEHSLKEIPQGQRNSTMSHCAGKIIKRYGETDKAYQLFLKQAENCRPPLPESELKLIWNSAVTFGRKVAAQDGYIPPEQWEQELKLKPTDFSDVGQATVLAREYAGQLRFSPATDYLVYNGSYWEESKPKSQAVAQELTTR